MALSNKERARRKRERDKAMDIAVYQMRITGTERRMIEKGAKRRGFEDQAEYLLSLVAADLEKPPTLACEYPGCDCPYDRLPGEACLKGYEEPRRESVTSNEKSESTA